SWGPAWWCDRPWMETTSRTETETSSSSRRYLGRSGTGRASPPSPEATGPPLAAGADIRHTREVPGTPRIRRSVDIHFADHIRGHDGACINLHGHTWKFEIGVEAEQIDEHGFVIDFARIRAEVLEPCYRLLDHALAIGELTFSEVERDLASLGEKL